MKRGEADNIAPQPRVGATQIDSLLRRWRKVRRLETKAYRAAVVDAHWAVRIGRLTEEHLRALGYELADEVVP